MSESYSITAVLQARVEGFVNGFRQATSTVDEFTQRNQATFDSFKKVGAAATAGGVAIAAGLGAAVTVAANFESQMSKVAAISGATGKDLSRLTETAKHLGATTSFSASQAGEGMEKLALAGWKTNDIISAMPGMLNLAAAGALDLGRAADITSDVMSAFGLSADKASHTADVFAYAQANANTNVEMMGDAMTYLAPVANALGWELEESAAAVMKLADSGVKGSMAGQAFASSLTRLAKPTKAMNKEMDRLGMAFFDTEGNMKSMPEVMKEIERGTAGMTKEQKSSTLSTLFGAEAYKHWAILLDAGSESLALTTAELKNADGAAADMAATMLDNLNGAITIFKSGIEGAAIAVGNVLLPHIRKVVEWLTSLVEKFNALDEKAQKVIVIIATLSAGFLLLTGPILMIIGFIPSILAGLSALTTVGTTLVSVFAGTATAASGVGAAIASMALPVAAVAVAIAGLTVGAVAFANDMSQSAIPAVERFGEGVSESTQQAVGSFMDMTEQANASFKELAWGQQAVTAEMANNMSSSQQEITETLLGAIADRHGKEIEATNLQFLKLESLSDEQKASIIEKTNARYEEEAQAVETGNTRIQEILQLAAEGNRAITETESAEILAIRQSMTEQAVEVLSVNEQEQRMILERMRDNATTLSTEEAAAIVQNSIAKKEQVITDAEDQFTQTRMWAEQQRDQLGTLSAEEAQQVIDEAQKKRDKTIVAAEEAHANVIAEAQAQADEHVNLVDWETGEILTKWDVLKKKHEETWDKIKSKFDGVINSIKSITSTGFNYVKDTISKVLDAIVGFIKPQLDKIKTFWEENGELIRAATKNVWNAIQTVIQTVMPIIEGVIKVAWFVIQTIVMSVWENIKGVISGALDIILGLVKVFAGLFTGDWSAMWDGVKQLFSGAVEFLWNAVQLLLWGRLLKGLAVFVGSFRGVITTMWATIRGLFTNAINAIRTFFTNGFNTMKNVANTSMSTIRSTVSAVWNAIRTVFTTIINTIKNVVMNGFSTVVTTIKNQMTNAVNAVKGAVSKFFSAGKDLIQGLINGIKNMTTAAIGAITGVVDSVVDKAKSLLGIKSPSRVMMGIGDDTGKGLVIGLNNQKGAVGDAARVLGQTTIDAVAQVGKITKGLTVKNAKERLDAIKTFVEDKKSLEQLSVVDEAIIWKTAVDAFKAGTKEKIELQKNYAKALDEVNKEITSINKKYADEMYRINTEFKKQEEDLTKKYQDTLESRMQSLRSFAGVFDEFDTKVYQSGHVLLNNLQGQVDGFKDWQTAIEKLAKRAIDDGLIAELTAMGPKALGELQALNSLSDEELSKYSRLYQEKSELARTQAEKELIGMKGDTQKQISDLRNIANTELSALQSDWQKEIKKISNGTSKELSSLNQIGKDSVQGLIDGMKAMHPDLKATANSLATTVSGTIKSSLQIKSPSRKMMGYGENVSEGLAIGIDNKADLVSDSAKVIVKGLDQVLVEGTKKINDEIAKIEEKAMEEQLKIQQKGWDAIDQYREDRRGADGKVRKNETYYEVIEDMEWDTKAKLEEIERLKNEEIEKLQNQSYSYRLEDIKKYYAEKKKTEDLSLVDELYFWDEAMKLFEDGSQDKIEAQKEYQKSAKDVRKEEFDDIKNFINEKKEMEGLSLANELKLWKKAAEGFEEGTAEKIASQKEYQRVVEEINKVIEAANTEHANKMEAINDKLRKDQEDLTAAYVKSVEDRTKSLVSTTGVFDEFTKNQEKSGDQLLSNLKSQVDGFKDWQENIASLSARAIDEGLMAELQAMGPKAAGELEALNKLTDEQLTEYSRLYQEKQALAREQAEKELVGMKDDTEKRIEELRDAANAELDILEKEWVSKIESVTKATDVELLKLEDIGKDAAQGLLDGLSSMEGALVSKAQSIANAVKDAMAGALDIHSPSRWMRDFIGKNMMYGWIDGMEAMRSKVVAMAEMSTGWMTPDMPVLSGVNVPDFPQRSYDGGKSSESGSDVGRASGGDLNQYITINSPNPTSPSENARKMKQASRDLLTGWSG